MRTSIILGLSIVAMVNKEDCVSSSTVMSSRSASTTSTSITSSVVTPASAMARICEVYGYTLLKIHDEMPAQSTESKRQGTQTNNFN